MAADPIGEDNPIEAILLTGFPNPERKGCPPSSVIEDLGNRRIGRDHPAWKHIWSCSPCFRDFKIIRDTRVAKAERAEERQRTRRRFLTAAATSAAVMAAGYFIYSESQSQSGEGVAVIAIDLTHAGPTRGANPSQLLTVAKLPRKLDELHITLPRSTTPGRYIVAILHSNAESTAFALASAEAIRKDSHTTLEVRLDLSQASSGAYFLGIRSEEGAQQGTPTYYPVEVT